jgi:hypothetical protein
MRASAFFAQHGITTERVLTDNRSPFRSHARANAGDDLGTLRALLDDCLYTHSFVSDGEHSDAPDRFSCTSKYHLPAATSADT